MPTITCHGKPIRSASANLTPGRSARSSTTVSVAPYEVSVLCLSDKDPEIWDAAGAVADACVAAGLETVVDDRAERPGVKFADADLIGFPWQVIVGKKGVANGIAEVKERATGERFEVALDEVASWLAEKILPEREL